VKRDPGWTVMVSPQHLSCSLVAKRRGSKKFKSVALAALKTLGTQYAMYSEMHSQICELCVEFEGEIKEVVLSLDTKCEDKQSSDVKQNLPLTSELEHHAFKDSNIDAAQENEVNLEDGQVAEHPWLRKLFKRIAIHCHPDKVGHTEHKKMLDYMAARKALDEENEPLMVTIGLHYNELPEIDISSAKKIMAEGIGFIESQVAEQQKSLAWTWGASEENFKIKAKVLVAAALQLRNITVSESDALIAIGDFFNDGQNVVTKRSKSFRKVGQRPEKLKNIRNGLKK